jgi:hypothetical protein
MVETTKRDVREALEKYHQERLTSWYFPPWVHHLAVAAQAWMDLDDELLVNWVDAEIVDG